MKGSSDLMKTFFVNRLFARKESTQRFANRSDKAAVVKSLVSDLIVARRAIDHGQLKTAEPHLRHAVDSRPEWAEAWALLGALRERLGEYHAAYQCYRVALVLDRYETISLGGIRRYCERFGLDFRNPAVNPAARVTPVSRNRSTASSPTSSTKTCCGSWTTS